jgi:peptidoglycan/xylan/chitin deacetylase (PgdA/CDA1 family)
VLDRPNGIGGGDADRPEDLDGPGADPSNWLGDAGADRPEAVADPGAERPEGLGDADPDLSHNPGDADADQTVALDGAGGDLTVALAGAGGDQTVAFDGAGEDRTEAFGGAGADRSQASGSSGWERLRNLGGQGRERLRRGRERLKDSKGAQQAAERIEQLKATRGAQLAGEGVERLKTTKGGQLAGDGVERLRGWGDEHPIARRRLLIAVPSAAGLALVAGAVEAEKPAAKPATTSARAVVRPRPAHPIEKTAGRTLPVQHKPVFTLSDYRRMTGAPPFPADAIALTIDDGPHPFWTPQILRLLDHYHVPAMFCMIGNQVLGHEAVARTVTKAGHQLANHTWSHPTELADKPRDQVRQEIDRAQAKIRQTTGYAPKLFRSPGGDWSPTVLQEAAHAGLIPLDWSDDPRDWSRPGVPHIKSKLMAARPGQILLCHDGGGDRSQTYAALSSVIPALKAKGLHFVAL